MLVGSFHHGELILSAEPLQPRRFLLRLVALGRVRGHRRDRRENFPARCAAADRFAHRALRPQQPGDGDAVAGRRARAAALGRRRRHAAGVGRFATLAGNHLSAFQNPAHRRAVESQDRQAGAHVCRRRSAGDPLRHLADGMEPPAAGAAAGTQSVPGRPPRVESRRALAGGGLPRPPASGVASRGWKKDHRCRARRRIRGLLDAGQPPAPRARGQRLVVVFHR